MLDWTVTGLFARILNKITYSVKDPEEEGEEGENVHLKTHATARGVGKNTTYLIDGLKVN